MENKRSERLIESSTSRQENEVLGFLEVFAIALKPYKITKPNILQVYKMIAEDRGNVLKEEQMHRLFASISQFTKIISVEEKRNEFFALDLNGKPCVVKWHVGLDTKTILKDINGGIYQIGKAEICYIMAIDLDQKFEIDINQVTQDKAPGEKPNKLSELEEDRLAVFQILGDETLHSDALLRDYGDIKYSDLFMKLTNSSRTAIDKRWVKYFIEPRSNACAHKCLVALRGFLRKHRDLYK